MKKNRSIVYLYPEIKFIEKKDTDMVVDMKGKPRPIYYRQSPSRDNVALNIKGMLDKPPESTDELLP
jgi:hypothetical protein